MLRWIVALLILVPALELWVLFELGRRIGGWQTFGLLIMTGVLGALLAKREFRRVWSYARYEMARGVVPTSSVLDAIAVFLGGLLLLTPGLLTDVVGFALLLPGARSLFKIAVHRLIHKGIASGRITWIRWRW